MRIYPENYTVVVTVPLTDLNGEAVTPTSITALLYDGDDEEVTDLGTIAFDDGAESVDITILAANNVLAAGELKAARVLRVSINTAAGTIPKSSSSAIILNRPFANRSAACDTS